MTFLLVLVVMAVVVDIGCGQHWSGNNRSDRKYYTLLLQNDIVQGYT